ncbi:MAG: hypothetical protein GX963_05735, partial [Bacteroidales bacterium]|nr:hypothetical protein [Bacteroidales bacterium]
LSSFNALFGKSGERLVKEAAEARDAIAVLGAELAILKEKEKPNIRPVSRDHARI